MKLRDFFACAIKNEDERCKKRLFIFVYLHTNRPAIEMNISVQISMHLSCTALNAFCNWLRIVWSLSCTTFLKNLHDYRLSKTKIVFELQRENFFLSNVQSKDQLGIHKRLTIHSFYENYFFMNAL